MKVIKQLSIVTAQGANTYIVGVEGITSIEDTRKQIGEYEYLYTYNVFKNKRLYAEISQHCPYEVIYKEED